MAEKDRFIGILETHLSIMQHLADAAQGRFESGDAYASGLVEGAMRAYRDCENMLKRTLEKEQSKT